jgi:hypothetical protein
LIEIVAVGEGLVSQMMGFEIAPHGLDRFVMMTLDCWFLLRLRTG